MQVQVCDIDERTACGKPFKQEPDRIGPENIEIIQRNR